MRKQQFQCSINKRPTKTDRYASIKPNGEDTQLNGEETQLNEKETAKPNSQNSSSHCSCHICGVKYA